MKRGYSFGALIALAFLVVALLGTGSGSGSNVQWAPWGRVDRPKEPAPLAEETGSAPLEDGPAGWGFPESEEGPESADEIVRELVDDFNERYGHDLEPPGIEFTNGTHGEYHDGVVHIPRVSEYVIAHETCHYFQDKTCRFQACGESFCEVFAKADRKEGECLEKGWPHYYCYPFRLEEVDRQGFLDCVFDGCDGEASREGLMECYEENRV